MTLWTFFKINPWFNACSKFLMWITYSFLSYQLAPSFSTFFIFFLSDKNGESLWISCNFPGYWTSTSRRYSSSLSSLQFFSKSSLNWEVSFIYSNLFTGTFYDIAHPYKLFTFQYVRWWFFFFIIIFHILIISFSISMSNNYSNFTSVF